ncbi:MAG TPA: hypothetical protein VF508_00840 [Pyrinomonadaceae bacterium]|jgi:hypothetical protein
MRLRRLLLTSALTLAAAPLSAAALVPGTQMPATVPAPKPGPDPAAIRVRSPYPATATGEDTPYVSTRSFTGSVYEVNREGGYIIVKNAKKYYQTFYVGQKTRLRADKETSLGGKQKLTLEDFEQGQAVKVTYWPGNYRATEVRLRRPKD